MKTKDFNQSLEWKQAWEYEYQKQGIPSSFRKAPARVVTEFYSWLEQRNFKGDQAADLGCGRGRNSLYLASKGFSVVALDLLEENIDCLTHQARSMKLPITAHAQNVISPWPMNANSLDIAIDIFCYKHLTNKDAQQLYRKELARTLKSTGYYFVSLASESDGFYGPLLTHSPAPHHKLVVDPYAQIESYLYSIAELTREFVDHFIVIKADEQESSSPMHGKEYTRKVLNLIMRKA
jgi:SAM-dependent methyltransferase